MLGYHELAAAGWIQWGSGRFWGLIGGLFFLAYGTWAGLWPEALIRSVAAARHADLDENDPLLKAITRFISVSMVCAGLLLPVVTVTTEPWD